MLKKLYQMIARLFGNEQPEQFKYARLITQGNVRRYEGEELSGLVLDERGFADRDYPVSETAALNMLGRRGYVAYDIERSKDGQIDTITFRLKAKV